MKINRLEAHDRLLHFKNDQNSTIQQGAEDCLKKNPLSLALQDHSPYIYIFAHPRTADDGVNKRLLWQPRLTKPKAQSNSYLFRAQSKSDIMEICWLIPAREMWDQYKKGNVTENEFVMWSVDQYMNYREHLERPDPEDLPDMLVREIYIRTANDLQKDKLIKTESSLTI